MPVQIAKPSATTRVNPSLGISSGLIGSWLMGNQSGPRVYDGVGNQTGTLTNFALSGTTSNWVNGPYGRRLNFDGVNDYIPVAVTPRTLSAPSGNITVASVISYTSTIGSLSPWCFGNTGTNNTMFMLRVGYLVAGGMEVFWRDNASLSTVAVETTTAFNDGLPHLVVCTKSAAGSVALWIDGKLIGTATSALGTMTPNTFAIGAFTRTTISNYFAGNIDNVSVWNRVLSPVEIYKLQTDPFAAYRRQYVPVPVVAPEGPSGSVGTASGTSTASGVGAALVASVASASGSCTVAATGAASADGVASASGTSTASAVGNSAGTGAAVGTASGTSTASAVGAAAIAAIFSAVGTCTVNGIAPSGISPDGRTVSGVDMGSRSVSGRGPN